MLHVISRMTAFESILNKYHCDMYIITQILPLVFFSHPSYGVALWWLAFLGCTTCVPVLNGRCKTVPFSAKMQDVIGQGGLNDPNLAGLKGGTTGLNRQKMD